MPIVVDVIRPAYWTLVHSDRHQIEDSAELSARASVTAAPASLLEELPPARVRGEVEFAVAEGRDLYLALTAHVVVVTYYGVRWFPR